MWGGYCPVWLWYFSAHGFCVVDASQGWRMLRIGANAASGTYVSHREAFPKPLTITNVLNGLFGSDESCHKIRI